LKPEAGSHGRRSKFLETVFARTFEVKTPGEGNHKTETKHTSEKGR
jgi:hypothetical protein